MTVKTYGEQLAALQETRDEKNQLMSSLMAKAMDEGRSLNTAEAEEFDTAEAQVKHIDADMARLRKLEAINSLTNVKTGDEVSVEKGFNGVNFATVKNTQKLEPGIAFARAAKCLAIGHKFHVNPLDVAVNSYSGQDIVHAAVAGLVSKAAVGAASTTNKPWLGNLVNPGDAYADFVEYLRPRTIVGRFGQGGVPSLRKVPFNVPLISQLTEADAYWTAQGAGKGVTSFTTGQEILQPVKVATIAVATMELLRDSSPAADSLILDELTRAIGTAIDREFIDPNIAAVAGVRPGSILNGVTPIPSSGNTADDIRADVNALFDAFIDTNNDPVSGVWIMSAKTAHRLASLQNPLGTNREFPGISRSGGEFMGLPVLVSQYVPTDSSGSIVALVNADDIYFGDDGGVDLAMSTEATLQMDTAPTQNSITPTASNGVSMFQTNSVAFRAERTLNWKRRRPVSVAYLTGVNWGS